MRVRRRRDGNLENARAALSASAPLAITMLGPKTPAPDISFTGWSLREALKSGPVALVFFKTSCPTCQYTLPFFERLHNKTNPFAPALVGISQDDAPGTAQFCERFGLSFPAFTDAGPHYSASNAYRITHVPSIFLIEPDGTISLCFDGFQQAGMEELGRRFGAAPFTEADRVPVNRPG